MKSVLFLVHRIPYPPDKGDKIRSYNILRFLSDHYRVFLGAFVDDPGDYSHRPHLESYCEELFLRNVGGIRSKIGAALSIPRLRALGVGYYNDIEMSRWVDAVIEREKIDGILIFSSVMAQYIPGDRAKDLSVVADFVDVDSDKWRQYSQRTRWPLSMVYGYEAWALERWERSVAATVDAVTLVSDTETALMRTSISGGRPVTVRNGVEVDYFDPHGSYESPYEANTRVIVFTGAMDYFANEEAVTWFVEEIWPEIFASDRSLAFFVVGSNPTRAVRELGQVAGVAVTGRVPDIRPYLAFASVAIAPLKLARGVQNKVLEALAMNVPVVATPNALQGLDDDLPASVLVAERGPVFARLLLEGLASKDSFAASGGREFVATNYAWSSNLAEFSNLLFSDAGAAS